MGLFSSREDDLKKLDDQLSQIDEEMIYKKALKGMLEASDKLHEAKYDGVIVLHHDLQEIKKELQKLNKK